MVVITSFSPLPNPTKSLFGAGVYKEEGQGPTYCDNKFSKLEVSPYSSHFTK